MSNWNPEQYERFKEERTQPFRDLVALIRPRSGMRVLDLGCGTGELTRTLHQGLDAHETLGVDSSETMLARSRELTEPGLRFEQQHIERLTLDGTFDLVFSNAALQWVPDHQALFGRLAALVAPNGQLAIQMPANDDHPSHRIAGEVAESLGVAARRHDVLAPEAYAYLFHELGFATQLVRLQVYGHLLDSSAAVVEWVKGTLLTDYQRRMTGRQFEEFLSLYRSELLQKLGNERPFFYPYKRLLLWASNTLG